MCYIYVFGSGAHPFFWWSRLRRGYAGGWRCGVILPYHAARALPVGTAVLWGYAVLWKLGMLGIHKSYKYVALVKCIVASPVYFCKQAEEWSYSRVLKVEFSKCGRFSTQLFVYFSEVSANI